MSARDRLDVAVLGGGILGVLTAREVLARRPDARVAVFDRDAVGSGASRRSAGLHFPRGSTERVRTMSAYSHDYYEVLRAQDPSLPIHTVELTLIADEANASAVEQAYLDRAKLSRAEKAPSSSLALSVPGGSGIWTGTGCQYAAVGALAQDLAQDLARGLRSSVRINEAVAVHAVDPGPDSVRLTLSTGETVTAGAAVLAPGPWLADPAWAALVAPLRARVKKVVALRIDRVPGPEDRLVVFHDADEFLLPRRDLGCWLYSYTCQDWDVDPDDLTHGLSGRDLGQALESLRRWSPELPRYVAGGRLFCDAYAADRQPTAATLDRAGRLVFAGAANGSGYRLGPAIAAQACDLLDSVLEVGSLA